jgi:small subunit ribosomal protein S8
MLTNTLADFITKIRNGLLAKNSIILQKKTNQVILFLNILLKEGFVNSYGILENNKDIIFIELKYRKNISVITKINLISKPSRYQYITNKSLYNNNIKGLLIISTSLGVITSSQAKKLGVGGKMLFSLY